MINMTEKTECPHCGNMYTRLGVHLLYCKEKPEEEVEIPYFEIPDIDDIPISDDYTSSFTLPDIDLLTELEELVPFIEAQTTPCPYLVVIAGQACSSCRGTSCTASSDKKISDDAFCKYEWVDCIQYEEAVEAGVRAVCPYLGLTIPEGRSACCGLWCHARDSGVRVPKVCLRWSNCGRYLQAKSDGKQFYRKQVT